MKTNSIKVMSQNLRCADDPNGNSIAERYPRFVNLVADCDPEIIGTQETTARWNALIEEGFSEKYGIFTGYSRNGVNETTGEYGTILYKKDRFDFIRGGTFWLSDTPDEKSKYPESSHLRICTFVILTDKAENRDIMFCNVHLSGGETAKKQLKVVAQYLEKELAQYTTFLTGDFNANPISSAYRYFKQVMEDSYVTCRDNRALITFTAHDYGKLTNAYRIDYCWHKGEVICVSYNTVTLMYNGYVSDHYAVQSEFIYAPKASEETTSPLRIMSQNMRFKDDPNGNSVLERGQRFKRMIAAYAPDLVGMQEASELWYNDLPKVLGNKYAVYNGDESAPGNGIWYRRDRFDLLKGGAVWLSDTPEVKSKFEESKHFRLCNYVILLDKLSQKKFMYCNVHLSGGETSKKQIKVMFDYLAKEIEENTVFLTGDFNARPFSSCYNYIESRMNDAYVNAEFNTSPIKYTAHDYGTLTNAFRIDWCFAKGDAKCRYYNTVTDDFDGYVSDHYAIVAEYEI